MKKIHFIFMLLLTSSVAKAEDFKVGGICYNILSIPDRTVEVTYSVESMTKTNTAYNISTFIIPEKVKWEGIEWTVIGIGKDAFFRSTITRLTLPKTIKKIGSRPFEQVDQLKLEWDMEEMGIEELSSKWSGDICRVWTGTIRLPEKCTIIWDDGRYGSNVPSYWNSPTWPGYWTYNDNISQLVYPDRDDVVPWVILSTSLKHLTLPYHMKRPPLLIECCPNLEELYFNNVDIIDHTLCYSCSGLKRIYLGKAPISEFPQPHYGDCSDKIIDQCPNLKDIIIDCDEPQDLWESAFTNGQYVGTTLWVPVGTADKYKSAKGWKNFMKIKEGRPNGSMCMVHTENSDNGSVEMLNTSKKANNNSDFVKVNSNASFVITPDEGMTVDSVIVNGTDMTSSITMAPYNVRAKRMRRAASKTNFMLTLTDIKRNTNVRVVYKEGNASETFIRNINNTTFANDMWYTIDGRQIEKKPTKKGIYIHNGKKVFVL